MGVSKNFRKIDSESQTIQRLVRREVDSILKANQGSSGSNSIYNIGGGSTGIPDAGGDSSGVVITPTAIPFGDADGLLDDEVTNLFYDASTDKFYAKRTTFESLYTSRVVKTANYTATADDFQIAIGTRATTVTITLPAASSNTNKVLIINDQAGLAATYNIIVARAGGDLIDGATTYTITSDHGSITVYSDGTDWYTVLGSSSGAAPVWTTVNGRGTFAARPAASGANAGYLYFETDGGPNSDGRMVRSNGAAWETVAEVASGGGGFIGGDTFHALYGAYYVDFDTAVSSSLSTTYSARAESAIYDSNVPANATLALISVAFEIDVPIDSTIERVVQLELANAEASSDVTTLDFKFASDGAAPLVLFKHIGGLVVRLDTDGDFTYLLTNTQSGSSGSETNCRITVLGYYTAGIGYSIVGTEGTMVEFDTACTDGNFVYQGETLGTPSSGTLTNATGLPEGGLSMTDITTNDFSTTQHGFVPKGTNVGDFLRDDGTWASVPASGLTFAEVSALLALI